MDIANLISPQNFSPTAIGQAKNIDAACDEKKKQFAKDFESIFINKLLDEMKNTIGNWGSEKDGPAKQIDGIFFSQLAQNLAGNGGIGMWKDIYKSLPDSQQKNTNPELLNEKL